MKARNASVPFSPFDQKRQKLSTSHIELNRWICDQPQWDEHTIEARSQVLAETAAELWVGPESFA
jgi:hypothetical protein